MSFSPIKLATVPLRRSIRFDSQWERRDAHVNHQTTRILGQGEATKLKGVDSYYARHPIL